MRADHRALLDDPHGCIDRSMKRCTDGHMVTSPWESKTKQSGWSLGWSIFKGFPTNTNGQSLVFGLPGHLLSNPKFRSYACGWPEKKEKRFFNAWGGAARGERQVFCCQWFSNKKSKKKSMYSSGWLDDLDALKKIDTLLGTNISRQNGILKMIFLFPRWDMLIPWRVVYSFWDVPRRYDLKLPPSHAKSREMDGTSHLVEVWKIFVIAAGHVRCKSSRDCSENRLPER